MEDIKKLRKICQGEKFSKQSRLYTLPRHISIHITRILLLTNITANQVTLWAILLGIAGLSLIGLMDYLVLLYLYYMDIL